MYTYRHVYYCLATTSHLIGFIPSLAPVVGLVGPTASTSQSWFWFNQPTIEKGCRVLCFRFQINFRNWILKRIFFWPYYGKRVNCLDVWWFTTESIFFILRDCIGKCDLKWDLMENRLWDRIYFIGCSILIEIYKI